MLLRTISLIALGLAAAEPALAQSSACAPVPRFERTIIERIIHSVRSDHFDRIEAESLRLHGGAAVSKNRREATLMELVRWSRDSSGLEMRAICRERDRATARVANRLTGAVDELRVYLDPSGSVIRVAVASAVAPDRPPIQRAGNAAAQMDAYLDYLAERDLFSGVVLITRNGGPVYSRAVGFADRERRVPNTMATMFNLASLNKIMTAVATMRLVTDGRLSLKATLGELLPEDVKDVAASAIRVDQLLSHTSGLSSGYEKLGFVPGTSYAYSNMGYAVLGKVIERKSALKYEDFVRLHVFGPADMPLTGIYEAAQPVPELSTGYTSKLEGKTLSLVANPLLQQYGGNSVGGFWSTAAEVARFGEGLRTGRLVPEAMVRAMRRPKVELGAPSYGFGVMRSRAPYVWGHGGDLPGTDADLEIYCDSGVMLVVLANRDNVNPPVLARARQLFFTDNCGGEWTEEDAASRAAG